MERDANHGKGLTRGVIAGAISYQRHEKGFRVVGWPIQAIIFCMIGLFLLSPDWTRSPITTRVENEGVPCPLAPRPADWLTPAPVITIIGDAGWTSCPWANGSGTWEDPYTICNLSINAGGSKSCITISNSAKYFKIVNCSLIGTTIHSSIELNRVGNGTIFNNTCSGNSQGISLSSACNNTISNNSCTGSSYRLYLVSGSNNNTLANNTCGGSPHAIWLESSVNNTLIGNTCTGGSMYGIHLYYSNGNVLVGNTVTGYTSQSAIRLWHSWYSTLEGNQCFNNYHGIILENASCSTFLENNCTSQSLGIYYREKGNNNTFIENTCWGNAGGMSVTGNNTILIGNNCSGTNGGGISCGGYNISIINNTCVSNAYDGISVGGSYLNITGNNCTHNGQYGITPNTVSYSFISGNNCSRNARTGIYMYGTYTKVCFNWLLKNVFDPMMPIPNDFGTNNIHDNFILDFPNAIITPYAPLIDLEEECSFFATQNVGFGVNYTYTWDFGDGTVHGNATAVTHRYSTVEQFTVTLTVTDSEGDFATATTPVVIEPPSPSGIDGASGATIFLCIGLGALAVICRKFQRPLKSQPCPS